jgi:hypothetical protein
MEGINQWLVELNKNSHVWFGAITVATMSGLGILIAIVIEVFKIAGVKAAGLNPPLRQQGAHMASIASSPYRS